MWFRIWDFRSRTYDTYDTYEGTYDTYDATYASTYKYRKCLIIAITYL